MTDDKKRLDTPKFIKIDGPIYMRDGLYIVRVLSSSIGTDFEFSDISSANEFIDQRLQELLALSKMAKASGQSSSGM